jgi:uncharacterized protein (TIGR02145 family)
MLETDTRWCGCADNNSSNCTTYGKLYQWSAAMMGTTTVGAQGVCPSGWHIPTESEWLVLNSFLGGSSVSGGKMKATTTWASPNTGATNESGFLLLPGGSRSKNDGLFYNRTFQAWHWSSEFSGVNSYAHGFYYTTASFGISFNTLTFAFSVRCIKN